MRKKTDWAKLEPKYCGYCESPFYHRKNTEKAFQFKKRRFCSNKCKLIWLSKFNTNRKAHNNRQIERICKYCSKLEMVSPAFANRPYCSRKCMAKDYRRRLKGENHWNWQGGITEDLARDILYPGYKEWRRKVFKRDGFKCILCGNNKSGELEAHHIKEVKNYKELVLDVNNGLTVCKECHRKIHYEKEIRENTSDLIMTKDISKLHSAD